MLNLEKENSRLSSKVQQLQEHINKVSHVFTIVC